MKEIEIKILEVDKEEVCKKLTKLGAKKTYEGLLKSWAYKSPNDKKLRVRDFGNKIIVTQKSNKKIIDGTKTLDELECEIKDLESFQKILEALNFELSFYEEKNRTSYDYDGLHFDIDEFPMKVTVLEIEGKTPEEVARGTSLLGYTIEQSIPDSFKELYARYGIDINKQKEVKF
jgi:adenylate cyclase, class 2